MIKRKILSIVVASICMFGTVELSGAASSTLKQASPPKASLGLKANGSGGGTADIHCRSDGGPLTVNVPWRCGGQFAADCKRLGGTLSGEQGWGGQTCHEPRSH